jgi:signal transduction histidine kinase
MPDGQAGSTRDAVVRAEADAQATDQRLLRRVRWRLALWSGGATLLVLLALGFAIWMSVRDALATGGIGEARARAGAVATYIEGGGRYAEAPLAITMTGKGSSTYAFLGFPEDGAEPQMVGPRPFDPPVLPDTAAVGRALVSGLEVQELNVDGTPWRIVTERRYVEGGIPYAIQVFQDRSAEQRALDTLAFVLVLGGLLALAGAMVVGAFYAGRALVPIRASLADRRLALRRQREFAADASHELRTPLTVVRSSVEHLRLHPDARVADVGSALDDIDAEVAHLSSLVEDLLLLARADSGALDLALQPCELGDVAAEAAAALMSPAAARDVSITIDPEPVMVSGDPKRLRQLVTILVDNAVRHSPGGSTVEVTVRRDREAAVLRVADHGSGIRPDDLPHVFDRFWRAPGEHGGGAGLGLAIAAAIVTRHGGRVGVVNAPAGGAVFTVTLPIEGAAQLTD